MMTLLSLHSPLINNILFFYLKSKICNKFLAISFIISIMYSNFNYFYKFSVLKSTINITDAIIEKPFIITKTKNHF